MFATVPRLVFLLRDQHIVDFLYKQIIKKQTNKQTNKQRKEEKKIMVIIKNKKNDENFDFCFSFAA